MSCKHVFPQCLVTFHNCKLGTCGLPDTNDCFSYCEKEGTFCMHDYRGGESTYYLTADIEPFSVARYDEASIAPDGKLRVDEIVYFEHYGSRYGCLVELKGRGVPHALEQMKATLQRYPSFWATFSKLHGKVISSSFAPKTWITSQDYRDCISLCKTYHGLFDVVQTKIYSSKISLFL